MSAHNIGYIDIFEEEEIFLGESLFTNIVFEDPLPTRVKNPRNRAHLRKGVDKVGKRQQFRYKAEEKRRLLGAHEETEDPGVLRAMANLEKAKINLEKAKAKAAEKAEKKAKAAEMAMEKEKKKAAEKEKKKADNKAKRRVKETERQRERRKRRNTEKRIEEKSAAALKEALAARKH